MIATETARRIYYDDSDMLAFTAAVSAVRELARVEGRQVWQVALDQTAFYPTSGGQPHDTGRLVATSRSGALLEVPVLAVEEDDAGEVWHTTTKPLQEGTEVRGTVDAVRRRDHMQQHTGQHLLSAVLHRQFGLKTVSFHLGAEISTIDLDGEPGGERAERAELIANELIRAALPVSVRYLGQADAERMLSEGILRKLPARSGSIRIVEIAGIDVNACGGTHVSNTAQIAPIFLRGTEKVRGGTRLSFLCGERAIAAGDSDHRRLTSLAQSLSTSVSELAPSIARLQADAKAAAKHEAALLGSLASFHAAGLAKGGGVVVHTLDPQQPGGNAAYARLLASRLVSETPARAALIVAPEDERTSIVLAAKAGALDCGKLLRTSLEQHGGRGGGSREMAQGALPSHALVEWQRDIVPQLA